MPFLNDLYVLHGWAIYLLFLGGMIVGWYLIFLTGFLLHVQVKRGDKTQKKIQRAEARVRIAKAQVDRILAEAEEKLLKTQPPRPTRPRSTGDGSDAGPWLSS